MRCPFVLRSQSPTLRHHRTHPQSRNLIFRDLANREVACVLVRKVQTDTLAAGILRRILVGVGRRHPQITCDADGLGTGTAPSAPSSPPPAAAMSRPLPLLQLQRPRCPSTVAS
jgi:hypothetical protein